MKLLPVCAWSKQGRASLRRTSAPAATRCARTNRYPPAARKHDKVHASDCAECETRDAKIDRIDRVLTLEGDLDDNERAKLLEIANKCPVHRTLHSEVWIPTTLSS